MKKVDAGQISVSEVKKNEVLNDLIFNDKFVEYTLNSNRRTGRYFIKDLYLTEKGKVELTLALELQRATDKSNLKIMLLITGILIGLFIGKLALNF
ncbi:hypothetical protein LFYK43_09180 [Ligilactobacillus salitolerans]|uniref:Uncharacterized protein n=1 Tax=Ligilactobacillus salitolerans TaxID=1808352 RepID=A0A401ISF6_9LACO|nr:hypothetical protein [Ligilactobacillus salitolerans]GBG94459.1 hypothetical protein LFYK43_09180 [Ligilactobacillus salitolerans]